MTTEQEIKQRIEESTARYKKRRQKELDIQAGRRFFVTSGLPLLVAYPSDKPVGVYVTFTPVGVNHLKAAVTVRTKKDVESFRRAKGILGNRILTGNTFDIRGTVDEQTLTTKAGGWKFKAIYDALNVITPVELMQQEHTPEWMRRILMSSSQPWHFMDHRLVRHIDASWPYAALNLAQKYYERGWFAPITAVTP